MIDLAKVADLVLLLCDASFGFEMEVFEFLNICQVHGMPRIMGILTHLDMIKNSKALKAKKKTLKHRFWTEVYAGAKLFYLSGILHGEYLRNEIKNLGRFISVMKFRPLIWRTTHSYILGDRYEDLTNQENIRRNPNCDRNISLYGYVRGVPLKKDTSVHVPGLGDLKISDMSYLPDPCPLPEELKKRALVEKEKLIYAPFSGVGGIVYDKDAVYVELGGSHSHTKKDNEDESTNIVNNLIDVKETLDVKMQHSEMQLFTGGEKLVSKDWKEEEGKNVVTKLYEQPQSKSEDDLAEELDDLRKNSCNKNYEEVDDGGRIRRRVIFEQNDEDFSKELEEHSDEDNSSNDEESNNTNDYYTLKENKDKHVHSKIYDVLQQLNSKKVSFNSTEEDNEESSGESYDDEPSGADNKNEFSDDDEESDEDDDDDLKWKDNLAEKAQINFHNRQNDNKNLMKLVYGVFDVKHTQSEVTNESEDEEEGIGGLFKKVTKDQEKLRTEKESMDLIESSLSQPWNSKMEDWLAPDNKALIINCFVTGKWRDSEDASMLLKLDDAEDLSDADSEMFGDFEDLETGEKHVSNKGEKRKREDNEKDELADKVALAEKKKKLKEKFDAEYDNTEKNSYYDELKMNAEKQAQLNKTVFENLPDDVRVQIEGFRPGMYVRMEFENIPAEFINNFDPTYPLIIGSLNMGEENIGYVNVKIKKHRWYKKILKTSDPLIISLGWRRFQTIPLYSKLEDDLKFRYLKYTPEHLACNAHFWGPITPQGTGFLALQVVDQNPEVSDIIHCIVEKIYLINIVFIRY